MNKISKFYIKISCYDLVFFLNDLITCSGLPWWLRGIKICLPGQETGSSHESGRSPGEGKGYPLQNSCPEKPMDRGAWRATVCGVTKIWTQLSD